MAMTSECKSYKPQRSLVSKTSTISRKYYICNEVIFERSIILGKYYICAEVLYLDEYSTIFEQKYYI